MSKPYAEWIKRITSSVDVSMSPIAAGASRSTSLVTATEAGGIAKEFILRCDTGDGPLSGTELSLDREGSVYNALRWTGVPIAMFVGMSDDETALLLQRVPGSANWADVGDAPSLRTAIADSFAEALATLHSLDAAKLDIPQLPYPATEYEHALNELAIWKGIFDSRVRRPSAISYFAFDWLRRNAPASPETVLCHGDAGPGNFMFEGSRLTALIDWEFAHFGDPMDDLAWLTVRGGGLGSAWPSKDILTKYTQVSGRPVDYGRLAYYQAVVVLRMAVACLVALDNRKGQTNVNTHFALLPAAEFALADLIGNLAGLGRVEGLDSTPPARLEIPEEASFLAGQFVPALASGSEDEYVRAQLPGMIPLIHHIGALAIVGREIEASCIDEVAASLGERLDSWTEAEPALCDAIRSGELHDEEAIKLLRRISSLRMRLWPDGRKLNVPTMTAPTDQRAEQNVVLD